MNDEALKEAFPDEEEQQEEAVLEQEEAEQEVEQEADEQEDPGITKARAGGWVPKEEWQGDPEDWKGYKAFNKDGELFSTLKSQQAEMRQLKQTMSDSLTRNNTFHKAQLDRLKSDKEELEAKFDQAVELADKEAVKSIRENIGEVEEAIDEMEEKPAAPKQEQVVQRLQSHPAIGTWVEENPWLRDPDDPRAAEYAGVFAKRFSDRASVYSDLDALVEDTINYTNKQIKKPTNSNRERAPVTAGGGKRVGGGRNSGLSMKDLTHEEKSVWETFKEDGWTEKDFLKTVEDSRT